MHFFLTIYLFGAPFLHYLALNINRKNNYNVQKVRKFEKRLTSSFYIFITFEICGSLQIYFKRHSNNDVTEKRNYVSYKQGFFSMIESNTSMKEITRPQCHITGLRRRTFTVFCLLKPHINRLVSSHLGPRMALQINNLLCFRVSLGFLICRIFLCEQRRTSVAFVTSDYKIFQCQEC